MPLRSPIRGVVVSHDVVAGEVVDASRTLFEIVDTSRVWLALDVRAEDVAKIDVGSKVLFKADGRPQEIEGSIASINTAADAKTRTVKVRVELANEDGKLRANTFGSGKIILRDEPEAIVVPSAAVHWEGDCHVVFVRDKNWLKEGSSKVFHTRVVRLGMRDESTTEIIAGVLPGEVVATKGSEILRAELLRGNFGEGCGCCKK
jgi:cobalt-zinc-cadmium efflux system membrane fusion protein